MITPRLSPVSRCSTALALFVGSSASLAASWPAEPNLLASPQATAAQPSPQTGPGQSAALGAGAGQQTPAGETTIRETEDAWKFTLTVRGIAELQSDFKNSAGTVEVYRAGFEFNATHRFSENVSAGVNLEMQSSWFNFNNAQALVPGSPRPYGSFGQVTIAPFVTCTPDQHWSFTVGGIFDFSGEYDADLGDSFAGGGFLVVGYKCSDKFKVSLGVVGTSRIEDSFFAYPYLGLDWQVSDKVSIKVYGNQNGPEARITGKLSDQFSAFMYASYQSRSYRLSDDSPIPDGVFRERCVPVVIGFSYKCCDQFELSAGGGVMAWRRYRQDNSDGVRISQIETDPGALLFLSGRFTF